MQGRVKQADADGLTFHNPEKLHEIIALHRQKAFQYSGPPGAGFRENHLAHDDQARGIKEHMFRTTQPDALRIEIARGLGVFGRVRVGTDANVALDIGPAHQLLECIIKGGFQHWRLTGQNLTRGAINGDQVAFAKNPTIGCGDRVLAHVKPQRGCADDTRQPHPSPDHGGVAGHAAAFGQNRDGGLHPAHIFGNGFATHQNTRLAPRGAGLSLGGGENDTPRSCARTGGNPVGQHIAGRFRVHLTVQKFGQHVGLDSHHRFLRGDDLVFG